MWRLARRAEPLRIIGMHRSEVSPSLKEMRRYHRRISFAVFMDLGRNHGTQFHGDNVALPRTQTRPTSNTKPWKSRSESESAHRHSSPRSDSILATKLIRRSLASAIQQAIHPVCERLRSKKNPAGLGSSDIR
jgi:hypothetical protein